MKEAISVVMPVYLGEYSTAAMDDRPLKFRRAINSFLTQGGVEKELVIVVDGCDQAWEICEKECQGFKAEITYIWIAKQQTFSGEVRNIGKAQARHPLICYLDSDDFLGEGHLQAVVQQFSDDVGWVYWTDSVVTYYEHLLAYSSVPRLLDFEQAAVGTSNIAHRKSLDVMWPDGYGHDWLFVERLRAFPGEEIKDTCYNVCHIPMANSENHEV